MNRNGSLAKELTKIYVATGIVFTTVLLISVYFWTLGADVLPDERAHSALLPYTTTCSVIALVAGIFVLICLSRKLSRQVGASQESLEIALQASKEAEAKLVAQHQFLERLLEAIPDPVSIKNKDLVYVYANSAYMNSIKRIRHEIIGKTNIEIFNHDDAIKINEQDILAFESKEPLEFEFGTNFEGAPYHLLIKKFAIPDSNGEPVLIAISRDVTEIKKSEQILADTLDGISDGIWTMDPSTRQIVYMNEKVPVIYGHRAENIVEEEYRLSIIHPDDLEAYKTAKRSLKMYGFFDIEYRIRTLSGDIRWVRNRASVSEGNGPKLNKRVKGIITDVTESKIKGIELRKVHQRLKIAAEMAGIGYWDWDAKDKRFTISATEKLIFGYRSRNPDFNDLLEVTHPEDWETVKSTFEASMLDGSPLDLEFRIIKVGEIRHIRVHARSTMNSIKGEVERITGVSLDITDSVRQREHLVKQTKLLHHTSKMTSLGEMASNIGHEINTPLSTVMTSSLRIKRMIEKDEFSPEKTLKLIKNINDTVDHIASIVTGLKQLARGEVGEAKSFSIYDIISQALNMSRGKMAQHGVVIKVSFPDGKDCYSKGQSVQLFEVVINLLNNAFDALMETFDEKVITIEVSKPTPKTISISITNTGQKIANNIAEKMFDQFFTTKSADKGTGLGLYLSQKMIKAHHGKLYLDQQKELTTFVIELPAVVVDNEAIAVG